MGLYATQEWVKNNSAKMNIENPTGTGSFSINRDMNYEIGEKSVAIGDGTVAESLNQFVSGTYNATDSYEYELISTSKEYSNTGDYLSVNTSNAYIFNPYTGEITLVDPISIPQMDVEPGQYFARDMTVNGVRTQVFERLISRKGYIYNVEVLSTRKKIYAQIIGNGESDSVRSNAHTLDWDGNAWYAGDVYTGSTSGTNKDEGSKKLATENMVNTAVSQKSQVQIITWEADD